MRERFVWMPDDAHVNAREVPVEVVVAQLDVDDDELRALASILAPDERERASAFVFDRDRRRFVVARGRLRQFVAARIGACPESVQVGLGARGKPVLVCGAGTPDLRFNLSHCDDLAAYAFATGCEVGIDIERVRAIRDADAIAATFFSPRENEMYQALPLDERPLGFFNCWTRKEAFIKAIGDGLALPLDSFDVSLAPGEEARIIAVRGRPGSESGWRMRDVSPAADFVGAVVVETPTRRRDPEPQGGGSR